MKITKKSLHMGWNSHDTEIIKIKKEMRELKASVLRLEKLTDEKLLDTPEPKLKQLDQSVFDGLDEKWRFAAVDKDGGACVYAGRPELRLSRSHFYHVDLYALDYAFDTTNWQNSLIERDKPELTGIDLCRAMLKRGDKVVLCAVSDDDEGFEADAYDAICRVDEDGLFESHCTFWWYVQPVNNQGEPLTAADAGL